MFARAAALRLQALFLVSLRQVLLDLYLHRNVIQAPNALLANNEQTLVDCIQSHIRIHVSPVRFIFL